MIRPSLYFTIACLPYLPAHWEGEMNSEAQYEGNWVTRRWVLRISEQGKSPEVNKGELLSLVVGAVHRDRYIYLLATLAGGSGEVSEWAGVRRRSLSG